MDRVREEGKKEREREREEQKIEIEKKTLKMCSLTPISEQTKS